MSPFTVTALGAVAACVTTGAWVPQTVKSLRTRSARDFSWPSLLLLCLGITLWLVYGIARRDPAIIGANAITLVLIVVITAVKIRHG